jgi:mannose-1-phosphate guanylyltransferase/mannose-6-phosphate isomerase
MMDEPAAAPLIRPVILSGGAGTRLWPVSRLAYPKQLLPIAADQTMLQVTALRASGSPFAPPIIVGDEEHRFFIKDQLERSHVTPSAIILEAHPRNTAPAIGLAAKWVLENCGDDLLLVLPSDHVIRDEQAFRAAVQEAVPSALAGGLVTFGVVPDAPNVGYGYIEIDSGIDGTKGAHPIARFVEKPSLDIARTYVEDGRHFWNSGMFLFRASVILDELARHAPEIASAVEEASSGFTPDGPFVRTDPAAFESLRGTSIDVAVMEKTRKAFVLPVDIGWSDVGCWSALWEIFDKDEAGNVTRGPVLALDSSDCLLRSEQEQLIVAIGLKQLAVVTTRDAILVTDLERSQDVREAVEMLRKRGDDTATHAAEVFRPWGSYQTTDRGNRFQTKRLVVNPGARLSLQQHRHRSEHWVVVAGTAEVTIGDEVRLLQENESAYIAAGAAHRLANPGEVPLHLIEVQCGSYLGEDDIIRIEDDYGREFG